MSTCPCSPDALTRVTFDNGTVLLRCPAHEAQRWLVDGQPVDSAAALAGLRELFTQQRGSRAGRVRTPHRVIQLPTSRETVPARDVDVRDVRVDDASLTALLQARGLTGSWAVA